MDIKQTNLDAEEEKVVEEVTPETPQTDEDIPNEETVNEEAADEEAQLTPEELIAKWKKEYNRIYLSVYDDQEFVWHKINRQEYAQIMDSVDENDKSIDEVVEIRQTLTLEYALLSPDKIYLPDILQEYPGILTSLTAEILKKSGFSKPLTVEI